MHWSRFPRWWTGCKGSGRGNVSFFVSKKETKKPTFGCVDWLRDWRGSLYEKDGESQGFEQARSAEILCLFRFALQTRTALPSGLPLGWVARLLSPFRCGETSGSALRRGGGRPMVAPTESGIRGIRECFVVLQIRYFYVLNQHPYTVGASIARPPRTAGRTLGSVHTKRLPLAREPFRGFRNGFGKGLLT